MRPLYLALLFTAIPELALALFIQSADSTRNDRDSLSQEQVVLTPDGISRSRKELGFQTAKINSDIPFIIFSGTSVYNTLRGRIPAVVGMSPSTTASLRNGLALVIIDGVPYNANIAGMYNMGAYEYDQITASGSPGAGFVFGGGSTNGSIFLTTKSGKDLSAPRLELNSYTTASLDDPLPSPYGDLNHRWLYSNTLSYSNDFGALDTRVSYNFRSNPFINTDRGKVHNHNIRVNTGAEIAKGLTARLILDYANLSQLMRPVSPTPAPPGTVGSIMTDRDYLQGNVLLNYDFGNGIAISTRHMLAKLSMDSKSEMYINGDDQKKSFHNLVVSFNRSVSPAIGIGAYAGAVSDRLSDHRTYQSGAMESIQKIKYSNQALIAGLNTSLKDFLFFDYSFRKDISSAYQDNPDFISHNVTGAFLWSHAFGLESNAMSMGKIRVAFTDADFSADNLFPYVPPQLSSMPFPTLNRTKNVDAGMDFTFAMDRLHLSFSYFRSEETRVVPVSGVPGGIPLPGISPDAELNNFGWELLFGIDIIKRKDLRLQTFFTWCATKSEVLIKDGDPDPEDTSPDFPGGPYPSWRSSFLNQLTYKNVFFNVLMDFRKDRMMFMRRDGNFTTTPVWDTKNVGILPDLSVGYRIQQLPRTFVKHLDLSLSARNVISLYESKPELEYELNTYVDPKTISLGITATF